MIYLIESSGYKVGENNSISYFQLLKIGYTDDNRKEEYKSGSGWKIKTLCMGIKIIRDDI